MQQPLRFKISSWRQLPQVVSNNSKKLHIHVTDFLQSHRLHGFRISVEHEDLGVMFAYILDACGSIVTHYPDNRPDMSPSTLLDELARFGFLVDYYPSKCLSGEQITFLMTVDNLHFDKIRILPVWEVKNNEKVFTNHIVAFQAGSHGNWLNNAYCPSLDEYSKGVTSGSAIDVGLISEAHGMDWSWLSGWVGSIPDILKENAEMSS